mmetsp:Transcript_55058/g.130683  ORF Transcript_55058/g.130683 Transcript_55058/m.130683 type:complete len:224 (-) Transcript_55058:317-988(-)
MFSAPVRRRRAQRRGEYSSLTELCPSCPRIPLPHVQTSPVTVMHTEWCPPHAIVSTMLLEREATRRGVLTLVSDPSPSFPQDPLPHDISFPAVVTARLWCCPAATDLMPVTDWMSTGVVRNSASSPVPSCPYPLYPQASSCPSVPRKTEWCLPSATMRIGSFWRTETMYGTFIRSVFCWPSFPYSPSPHTKTYASARSTVSRMFRFSMWYACPSPSSSGTSLR